MCRWQDRKNLNEYCCTCSFGTIKGCDAMTEPAKSIRSQGRLKSPATRMIPQGQNQIKKGRFVIRKPGRPYDRGAP